VQPDRRAPPAACASRPMGRCANKRVARCDRLLSALAARGGGSAGGGNHLPAGQPLTARRTGFPMLRGSYLRRPGPDGARVQAICDFRSQPQSRSVTSTRARDHDGLGSVSTSARASAATFSRTFAIAFCRCMNIPARYCTGYPRRHGHARCPGPQEILPGWFEAYLGGRWYNL